MQNLCKSFLLEAAEAIHDLSADQFKLALYTASAVLDPATVTAYSATNEVAGTGYAAGGYALTRTVGFPKLSTTANKMLLDFADVAASASGFSPRYGLIYNSTKGNRAVAVLDFGIAQTVTASLSVVWPVPDDNNAIIRLGC